MGEVAERQLCGVVGAQLLDHDAGLPEPGGVAAAVVAVRSRAAVTTVAGATAASDGAGNGAP